MKIGGVQKAFQCEILMLSCLFCNFNIQIKALQEFGKATL